jgi:putative tricarboxylic transport membrane protein
MGKADRISGTFWLIFGAVLAIESYRMGLGSLHQPGPGFLSFYASLVVGSLALVNLIQAWSGRKTEKTGEPIFGKQNTRKIMAFLISVFLYAALLETLGFLLVTFLLFLFLLGVIEKKKRLFTVLASIAVTAASYLIFEVWLMSQLPRGALWDLLRF